MTQVARRTLSETLALRRKQDDALIGFALGPDTFDGVEDGRGFQQHAFAAAKRAIIDGAMAVMRPGTEVVDVDLKQAGFRGFGDDTVLEGALEEVGKDGEYAKNHATGG